MFGIAGFGAALGEPVPVSEVVAEYSDDTDRILAYGYQTVHRTDPAVQVSDLAFAAATEALAEANIGPGDLDLVVLALTDLSEYLYWDAAAALQHRLGAVGAEAVLISQACTAALAGLSLAAGRFATQDDYRTALVVGANRCCEPYWNRMQTQSMVFSDGAAAVIVRRDHDAVRWLGSHLVTDGRFADFYRMDAGGTAAPFGPGADQPHARDAWDIMEFFDYDDVQFDQFSQLINSRTREVVDAACARAGVARSQLARVVFLHDNRRAMTALADAVEIPLERTNIDIGLAVGHLGAADQLYSLRQLLVEGALHSGDLVALVGLGRGMHWGCTVIRV